MKKYALISIGGVALSGILWFAYYAISPLFINIKIDEAAPQQALQNGATSANENQSVRVVSIPRVAAAKVVGTTGHPASGTVRVVEADGKTYVRYENFKTINGPDIYVYLAKNLDAKEFVNLGAVKATEGNINYEVPAGVEIATYPYVLTWCKAFGVLFNYADLSQLH